MRSILLAIFLVLAITACGGSDGEFVEDTGAVAQSSLSRNMSPSETGIAALTAGNRDFGVELYRLLGSANPGQNVFVSPHSISLALAMTYAGAAGNTATQMRDVLRFGGDQTTTHEAFNALDLELATRGDEIVPDDQGNPFELSVVNAAWGQTGYTFLPGYLDVLALNYGAGIRLLDFAAQPDPSRLVINDWVADQSNDRIKDLLPPNSISELTRLVLTNVIYFKANWMNQFDKAATQDGVFHRNDGSTVTVPTMHINEDLAYGTAADCQFVALPYVGGQVAMYVIVPDAGRFDAVEAALDGPTLGQMIGGATMAHGKLALPKFTFEFSSVLNDALVGMGMTDAFDGDLADFSGINGIPNDLFISLVIHKSFVAVDEDGTEAAAATAVVMDTTGMPTQSFDLTVDRPFLFAIVDRPTGALLFMGRVTDPS